MFSLRRRSHADALRRTLKRALVPKLVCVTETTRYSLMASLPYDVDGIFVELDDDTRIHVFPQGNDRPRKAILPPDEFCDRTIIRMADDDIYKTATLWQSALEIEATADNMLRV